MCSARIDQPPSKKSRSSVHPCQGLNPSSTATTRRRPNHSSWGLSFSRFCFSLFQTELNTSVSTLSFQRLSSRSSTRNNSSSFSSFCRILFFCSWIFRTVSETHRFIFFRDLTRIFFAKKVRLAVAQIHIEINPTDGLSVCLGLENMVGTTCV